ncbi:hypothetical protein IT418_04080 [bacterium]|nr:hypothetical protein [bacterium]
MKKQAKTVIYLSNPTSNQFIFGVNPRDISEITRRLFGNQVKLTSKVSFDVGKEIQQEVYRAYCEFSPAKGENRKYSVQADELLSITKSIKTSNGINLYSELIAYVVSGQNNIPVEEVFAVMNGMCKASLEEYPSLVAKATEVLLTRIKNVQCIELRLPIEVKRLKQIDRYCKSYRAYVEREQSEFSYDGFSRYVQAMDIISHITNPRGEKRDEECYLGNLQSAILEAIVYGLPIHLVKVQCLRLLQDNDSDGRNRIGISTNIGYEEIETRGGKIRRYEDTTALVRYLHSMVEKFEKLNISIKPVVLLTDDDVSNMYPSGTVIPLSDEVAIKKKAHTFAGKLNTYAHMNGYQEVDIVLMSEIGAGTEYERVKTLVRVDCERGGINGLPLVAESIYTVAVEADYKKYGNELGYPVEVSKFKVGNAFGVLFGLYEIGKGIKDNFGGNVVLIARDKPYLRNFLAVPVSGQQKERFPAILVDSERNEVFYEKGSI